MTRLCARLWPLKSDAKGDAVANVVFDDGELTIDCNDPALRQRLVMVFNLPGEPNPERQEAESPGTEKHFRECLVVLSRLGLRVTLRVN